METYSCSNTVLKSSVFNRTVCYTVPDAHVPLEAVKGGNAVKHWAHLRLLFRRGPRSDWPEAIKLKGIDGIIRKVYPGWSGRIKVDKTRINPNEGKEVLLPFTHGKGFDSKISTINSAFGLNLITRGGAIYTSDLLPNGSIKGKDNVIQFFLTDDEAYSKLCQLVLSAVSSSMEVIEELGSIDLIENTESTDE